MMIYSINRQTANEAEVTVMGPVTDLDQLTSGTYAGLEGLTVITKTILTLGKASQEEALQGKLNSIAESLPDEIAVQHPDIYPVWASGTWYAAQARVQHNGRLYRVQQAHTAEHPPSVNTAALYTRIQSPGAVQAWVTGQSYAKGVEVTHNGKTWISMVDNNVWEPGAAGVYKSIWKEVS